MDNNRGSGNLILTRKKNQGFAVYVKQPERRCLADICQHTDRNDVIPLINSVIKIMITDIQGGQVKVLFNAPPHIAIQRLEIFTPPEEVIPILHVEEIELTSARKPNLLRRFFNTIKNAPKRIQHLVRGFDS